MNAYDVFIEPTVVTDCLSCHFISSESKCLVVAKSTILEIYEVIKLKQETPAKGFHHKLKLVTSYKLQGEITDVNAIRTVENPNLDYLLVSTKCAKISCIKWVAYKHSIAVVSLHYYEHAMQNLSYEKIYRSVMTVGSSLKPLVCLRRNNLLVFLPFAKLEDEDDEDEGDDMKVEPDGKSDAAERIIDVENEESLVNANSDPHNPSPKRENMNLFEPSFIVDVATLDTTIGDIVDLQFLYGYREPTVAILSQRTETWAGLLPCKKDNIIFTVWSLDESSSSATTILKIEDLPFDLDRIVPLPAPVGGSLLLGCNELIHVDSGGINRGIALNLFVDDITASTKSFADQSEKEIKLEGCAILAIPNDNRALMVLRTGAMYFITFYIDGKSVKKITVDEIDASLHPGINIENPGDIRFIDENLLFFAGKSCNSVLAELKYEHEERSMHETITAPEAKIVEEHDDDDDDLYEEEEKVQEKTTRSGAISLMKQDELINNGPISSFTLGQYSPEKFVANLENPSYNEVSIFAAGGVGSSGHFNILTPTVQPLIKSSLRFSQINRLWIISNKYLITSDDPNLKSEIFDITRSYARLPAKHFVHAEKTISMHEMKEGQFFLQITPKQVILFNKVFRKVVTLEKELAEFGDAYIINSVFSDDILMIFFSTGEVVVYNINTYNKTFTKIELPKLLSETIITAGYITNSRILNVVLRDIGVLINRGSKRKRDSDVTKPNVSGSISHENEKRLKVFVLVTGDNRIVVFSRFHNEKCFQLNSANKYTDTLSLGFFDINGEDPDPSIKQVILNDLGDEFSKDEYLTILTIGGEIYLYKMFFDGENYQFIKQQYLPITGAPQNAYPQGTYLERRMIYFPNVSGMTCIMVTGVVPYFITASRRSQVKVFKFSKIPIISFVPYSDGKIKNGLIYLDTKKNARIIELPHNFSYENNWPMRRIHVGETVKSIAYHETSHTCVVSSFKEIPYDSLDEEGNLLVGTKKNKMQSLLYKGQAQLFSPVTWTAIDKFELQDNEVGLQVKTMILDVGSSNKRFKNQKEFVLIGTGRFRVEDLASYGSFKLFEIIDIIPEPGKPETNHKFKEFTTEETRGAVTTVCDVSGRFLVAQGQKIIVRDIKDNSAVPVAFFDLSVYVSESKSFGNLVLFGDTLKSITLVGFDAEPFRMIFLGKDLNGFDVSCADFLFKDEEIYVVVADDDKVVRILQYNPEDPISNNGSKLLLRSSFSTNYSATCMKSVPKHEQFLQWSDPAVAPFQAIASTAEGAMYVVFPINEATYRRMYIMQQQISDKEFHHCGMNPKLNRSAGAEEKGNEKFRPVLDCELIKRFAKLNQDRQSAIAQKLSVKNGAVDAWKDLIEIENVLNNL